MSPTFGKNNSVGDAIDLLFPEFLEHNNLPLYTDEWLKLMYAQLFCNQYGIYIYIFLDIPD